MNSSAISYDEVLARLREAEGVIQALLSAQADAVITPGGVHMLRLHATDHALHAAKTSLEQLLADRTRHLMEANEELLRENAERKRAEAALAASESRFRALLESASEAVIAGPAGRIELVNASTERMFGYERRELSGLPVEKLLPADGVGRRKDGSEFSVEVSRSIAEVGGEQFALALIADITERKRMEDSLREMQKLESIGLIAGGVAHDFNNLLTAILGHASLLLDDVPAPANRQLQAVIGGAEKAAQVTRQLLAYAGKGQFHITDLDLSALLRENADLIRVSIPKHIEIRLELKDNLPRVQADAGQIQQVLMNLVINAGEAIGEGRSGLIRVATDELVQAGSRSVRVRVSDNGCGMSESTRDRIFDPFFTTKVYGRGLGLSAVRGILRTCAGSISVESAPGCGTTFQLLFPAVAAGADAAYGSLPCAVASRDATVLVVDDEDGVRAFASAALRGAGYRVLEATHGKEAVDLIGAGEAVDLVLLDVTMPVMGGREALERIVQLRPGLNVMVTSGYGSDEVKRLMSVSGSHAGFIQKPYTAQQLRQCIDSALAK